MLVIFPVEVLASAMLMGVIFYVVYTKGLRGFSGVAIGGIVGLDILFLAFISGASNESSPCTCTCIIIRSNGKFMDYIGQRRL